MKNHRSALSIPLAPEAARSYFLFRLLTAILLVAILAVNGLVAPQQAFAENADEQANESMRTEDEQFAVEDEGLVEPSTDLPVDNTAATFRDTAIRASEATVPPGGATWISSTEYSLTAGHYTAGVDIPAGRFNIALISGSGNVISSNSFLDGGINEIFGRGTISYIQSYSGVEMSAGDFLFVGSNLSVRLNYVEITAWPCGRALLLENAIELNSGNHKANEGYPAGSYTIIWGSGSGNIISDTSFLDKGINEIFGDPSGVFADSYIQRFDNVSLSENSTLQVLGGLSVRLVPVKTNTGPDSASSRLGVPALGEQGSRYKTMQQIVNTFISVDNTKPNTIILAKGDNFPDALSVAGLAGIYSAPILTSPPSGLIQEAKTLISSIQPARIYVLGDEKGSFSASVLDEIRQLAPSADIRRLAGTNRYSTALEIYRDGTTGPEAIAKGGWSDTAIITRGDNFADALSMSSFAWTTHSPVFLADPTTGLSAEVLNALVSGNFSKIYLLGDEKSTPASIIEQLASLGIKGYTQATRPEELGATTSTKIVRLAGSSRYQTSVLIAEEAVAQATRMGVSLGHNNTIIAKGTDFPDALAGGALAGKLGSTLVLANPGAGASNYILDNYLAPHRQGISSIYVLGDENSIPADLLTLIEAARAG
jgi:putative cell wall-binding protein